MLRVRWWRIGLAQKRGVDIDEPCASQQRDISQAIVPFSCQRFAPVRFRAKMRARAACALAVGSCRVTPFDAPPPATHTPAHAQFLFLQDEQLHHPCHLRWTAPLTPNRSPIACCKTAFLTHMRPMGRVGRG